VSDAGLDLVAGGAGFLGSHLVEALLARGHRVRVLDDLSTGREENLAEVGGHPALELVVGDAADAAVARDAMRGVERVFHLAARPSVPWSVAHPEAAHRANHQTTLALLEAARAEGVSGFVFSSSSAIYGERPGLPKREDDEPDPRSPYAEHKLLGERALAEAAAAGGPPAVSLRYFNAYGPRQDPSSPYSGVISIFADRLAAGVAPTIYGDGLQTRDFVFCSDVVAANLAAAEAAPRLHAAGMQAPVVNVGTGREVTIVELWRTMARVAAVEAAAPEFAPPRPGDVRHSRADVERAADWLGFRAGTSLEEGLRTTLATLLTPPRDSESAP